LTPAITQLLAVMRALRDEQAGCPWDLAQDAHSLAPYAIEEAYEVADAIARGDNAALRDELGDLLFQVVFHAQLAEEQGLFDFNAIAEGLTAKMIRRHPHVFDAEGKPHGRAAAGTLDVESQTQAWEAIKKAERSGFKSDDSALAGIARGLPEWQRANKLQSRAATEGFDWPDVEPVFAKLQEELQEVRAELAHGRGHAGLEDEIGDVLFVCVNLARHAKVDFGSALRRANAKFERRYRAMEQIAKQQGGRLSQYDLTTQEALWLQVKHLEAANDPI
jgi:nucleoside triphosphate diphosphatase